MNEAWIAAPSLELCNSLCTAYRYFGLRFTNCLCGNSYGAGGPSDGCGDQGSSCTRQETCPSKIAVWQTGAPAWSLQHDVVAETKDRSTCWATLPALVPYPNTLSDIDGGTASSQGASYFTERFCPGWAKFVSSNSCLDSDPGCDASGSAIFDGGQDMVNILLFRCFFDFLKFKLKIPENTSHCCVHSMISATSCPAASWTLLAADMLALCLR